MTIAAERLRNQYLTRVGPGAPAGIVAWQGAVQAQEFPAARWGLALRMPRGATDAQIARAFDEGQILRTHVMRPTWHFVTPADIRWMLELTAPRVHRTMSTYYRHQELDAATRTRAAAVFEQALGDGQHLTRAELGAHLASAGIVAKGIRLALLTIYAELEAVMCSGAQRGKQSTYALLASRAPRAARVSRDEAIAELTRRFFRSHAPATVRDFVWWSGLLTADARRGLEMVGARSREANGLTYWTAGRTAAVSVARAPRGAVHLLPIYDEYLVAYRDRQAAPHAAATVRSRQDGPVTFQHALVIDGQVAGTWKTKRLADRVEVNVYTLRRLSGAERLALAQEAERFSRFLDLSLGPNCRIGRYIS